MRILKRFFRLLKPHYMQGLGIFFILLISTLVTVGTPFIYKELVDNGIMKGNPSHIITMLMVILAAGGLSGNIVSRQNSPNLNYSQAWTLYICQTNGK
jgi:ABC-type multidrug transport system fused ATPase/permease subunit